MPVDITKKDSEGEYELTLYTAGFSCKWLGLAQLNLGSPVSRHERTLRSCSRQNSDCSNLKSAISENKVTWLA